MIISQNGGNFANRLDSLGVYTKVNSTKIPPHLFFNFNFDFSQIVRFVTQFLIYDLVTHILFSKMAAGHRLRITVLREQPFSNNALRSMHISKTAENNKHP